MKKTKLKTVYKSTIKGSDDNDIKQNNRLNNRVRSKSRNIEVKINKDDIDYGVSDNEVNEEQESDIESNIDDNIEDNANLMLEDEEEEKLDIPDLVPIKEKRKERYEYKPEIIKTQIIMHPANRITKAILSKFEYTEVISQRSKQIENGGRSFTDDKNLSDPIEIAKKEIADKKCPICIDRYLPNDIIERWKVNELAIPDL